MERRLQLLLDHERYDRVSDVARREGMSVSAVIRQAIDVAYPDVTVRRSEAIRRLLAMAEESNARAETQGVPDAPFDKDALLDDVLDGIDA